MHEQSSPLLTDLYQLTMLQGYVESGMEETSVFEFFVRRLPPGRGFLVAAGLEQLVDFLEGLRFSQAEIDWLAARGFSKRLIDRLSTLRFTGEVDAVPEGTIVFADEPIVRVTAPLPEAQLIESRVINLLHFQTLVASKAARCVLAAPGKLLVDFGMRRAHGAEAALLAARACYIAGFTGSSTVLAEQLFGIPSFGTMAHSFIQAHDSESEAFESFARALRRNITFLIDTYDTEAGARCVVELAPRLERLGIPIRSVRLDSGDLLELSRRVRRILDDGGLCDTTIFASGGLDEAALAELERAGAPIDGYGVGTRVDTSADAPYFDCAYKLQEYAGRARRKRSEGKATWPGRKQVFRRIDERGRMAGDIISLVHETHPGEALLRPVMRDGKRLAAPEPLAILRERTASGLAALPPALAARQDTPAYPVTISDELRALAAECDRRSG